MFKPKTIQAHSGLRILLQQCVCWLLIAGIFRSIFPKKGILVAFLIFWSICQFQNYIVSHNSILFKLILLVDFHFDSINLYIVRLICTRWTISTIKFSTNQLSGPAGDPDQNPIRYGPGPRLIGLRVLSWPIKFSAQLTKEQTTRSKIHFYFQKSLCLVFEWMGNELGTKIVNIATDGTN